MIPSTGTMNKETGISTFMFSFALYNSSYSTNTVLTLTKVCEPKYTPLSIIFYNKYGALQNMWFFKKSTTDINITSEKFKNNMIDFDLGF